MVHFNVDYCIYLPMHTVVAIDCDDETYYYIGVLAQATVRVRVIMLKTAKDN